MEAILTPEQMREADRISIENIGIPGIVLMENAARSIAVQLFPIIEQSIERTVLILCGSGNNGGDGFALARHLHEIASVTILWIGDDNKMSAETLTNFNICQNLDVEIIKYESMNTLRRLFSDFDIIVDAMIGVGGSENLKGDVNDILNWVKDKDSLKCAIDVPTGLNSLTGKASDNCFEADLTITMFAEKIGLLINQGADKSGFVNVADLGAPSSVLIDVAKIFKFNIEDIKLFLPKRKPNTSKFDYGRVLIVAGSAKYPGAAALTANAAISMGTGLVELFTEVIHPSLLPEIIVHYGHSDNYFENQFDEILNCLEKADSIVIGPGLGHENIGFAKKLIEAIPNDKKIIVDADAIAALDYNKCYDNNLIITPHLGEFTRLIDIDRNEIDDKTLGNCIEVAKKMNIIVHLKHYPSITSDGTISFLTTEGNPGMATAGSGDVLSGIIGALAGLGLNSLRAAAMGAYIHALAGDNYADEFDEYSLTASKIIERIPYVLSNSYNISDEDNYDEEDN